MAVLLGAISKIPKSLREEVKQFIREESQESGQGYTYRYKVVRGQDILLKEKNRMPIKRWNMDSDVAIHIAERLNKINNK